MYQKSIHWFRRDLRLSDNRSLFEACQQSKEVIPVFIFDKNILNKLEDKEDRRVSFIFETLQELKSELLNVGSDLLILYGDPTVEIEKICMELNISCVFTNKDYEPYAIKRDHILKSKLHNKNIDFLSFKDQVIFEEKEILNISGEPYKVFTPYKNAWLKAFKTEHIKNFSPDLKNLMQKENIKVQSHVNKIEDINFTKSSLILKSGKLGLSEKLNLFSSKINCYDENRNEIEKEGTSLLSIYLRFGVVSIRELFRFSNKFQSKGCEVWKSELIWREFYQMILSQFPHVAQAPFKNKYETLKWKDEDEHYIKWTKGETGFPIIDAAMRYFNQTGWMHNRLRMIVASFLTKDLLIDYRKGEEYFAQKLLDFDLASNNGGWQWCASTGCDAQPYFRVFNPETQSKNFDPLGIFIKKNCPELKLFSDKFIHAPYKADLKTQQLAKCIIGKEYPFPIVCHEKQRLKAIEMLA